MTAKKLREFGGEVAPRSLPQRWVLATQGVLVELFNSHHGRMGGLPRPQASNIAALFLRRDWGVRSRREATSTLDWLFERGHRFTYADQTEHTASDLLAWDLVRAAGVAGWSYAAYLLEAHEAWPIMVRAARELQAAFTSWAAVGASYTLARNLWQAGGEGELPPIIDRLLAPGGGWDLPWDVDISGEIAAPIEPLRELVVDAEVAGDGLTRFATIGEAVAAVTAAGVVARIVVRPGTYVESVRISCPIELVADGAVTIQCDEGPPLVIRRQCAYVRGFQLTSGTSAEGETMHAVWAEGFFLQLVDCTIRSARCGVYADGADAFIVLERCRVESAGNTGLLSEQGAHLILIDSVVRGTRGAGVIATGDGELGIEASRIEDTGNSGLSVAGSVLAEISDLVVERSGHNGIELLERSRGVFANVTVRGATQTGLLASTLGSVGLTGCTIVESGGNDLGIAAGRVTAERCTLGGGLGCGLCVCNGARAVLEGCTVLSSAMPSATVMGGGAAIFDDCDLRGGRDTALWVMPGGSVAAYDCTIAGGAKTAVLLKEAHDALFVGGAITSEAGCIFAVGSGDVVLRGVELTGGSPAVCAQLATELVLVDVKVTTDGAVALAIDPGARGALTRSVISAPGGKALTLEQGEAHIYGGGLRGAIACDLDGASVLRSWAASHEGPVVGTIEELDIDEALHAPGTLTLVAGKRLELALDATTLEDAFAPHGLEPAPSLAAAWLDRVLGAQELGGTIRIRATDDAVVIEADELGAVHAALAEVRRALVDPPRLAHLARQLAEAGATPLRN